MKNLSRTPRTLISVLCITILLFYFVAFTSTLLASRQFADDEVICDVEIEIESVVHGEILTPGDVCVYQFTGHENQVISIEMNATDGDLDPVLQLFDPDGNGVAHSDDTDSEPKSFIQGFNLLYTGQYTIIASGFGETTGSFRLRLSFTESKFIKGDTVYSTKDVNLRQLPAGNILLTIPKNQRLEIIGDLTKIDGNIPTWWPVSYGALQGYVAQETAEGLELLTLKADSTVAAITQVPTTRPTATPNIELTQRAREKAQTATAAVNEWQQNIRNTQRNIQVAQAQATIRAVRPRSRFEIPNPTDRVPATEAAFQLHLLTTVEPIRETEQAQTLASAQTRESQSATTQARRPPNRTTQPVSTSTPTRQATATATKRATATPRSIAPTPTASSTPQRIGLDVRNDQMVISHSLLVTCCARTEIYLVGEPTRIAQATGTPRIDIYITRTAQAARATATGEARITATARARAIRTAQPRATATARATRTRVPLITPLVPIIILPTPRGGTDAAATAQAAAATATAQKAKATATSTPTVRPTPRVDIYKTQTAQAAMATATAQKAVATSTPAAVLPTSRLLSNATATAQVLATVRPTPRVGSYATQTAEAAITTATAEARITSAAKSTATAQARATLTAQARATATARATPTVP